MVEERRSVSAVGWMDAVAKGEADPDGLVEGFVFRNGIGDRSCELENALARCSARFRHQNREFVFVDSGQHVEIA